MAVYRHFDLAGVGHCWIEYGGYTITCRSTENGPLLLLVSAFDDDARCASDLHDRVSGRCLLNRTIVLKSTLGPLTPLILQTFSFSNRHTEGSGLGRVFAGEIAL